MGRLSRPARLGIALATAAGAALACVIVLAIVDLYLTGHGHASIMRETVTWEAAGVHMSPASFILLATVVAAALAAWRVSRPRGPRR